MKTCPKCKENKNLDEFSKDSSRKDGVCYFCKACTNKRYDEKRDLHNKRKREYYQENKDEILSKMKVYREKNKEKRSKQSKEYHQKNKERENKRMRENYAKRKDEWKARKIEKAIADPYYFQAKVLHNGMKARSRSEVIMDSERFTVSFIEDMLRNQSKCQCCGVSFNVGYKGKKQGGNDSPSLDRFIPEKGYVKGNVILICLRCNILKRDATCEELQRLATFVCHAESGSVKMF